MKTTRAWLVAIALTMSCGEPNTSVEPEEPADGLRLLSPRRQLIRLSVDLRGVHPTATELDHIERYPASYEQFVDRYLQDERFVDRMKEIWNRSFRTQNGETYFDPEEAGLAGVPEERVADSVGDEPLALIGHVIAQDLPWSEVITADYTMADPILAAMWGIDYPAGQDGWQKARYMDGRPHVGVLSSTTMWLKYPSAGVNHNRHRANNLSRIFLCDDYLSRPVSFSRTQIDSLTNGDPEDVIRETPLCQSCHSTLDPLSSHFYGFWWEIEGDLVDQTLYRPEDETIWRQEVGGHVSPAFYGIPSRGLPELAQHLAEDPRFIDCAVETVFNGLTERISGDPDREELAPHRDVFASGGLIMRDLVKSIVLSRPYRAETIADTALASRAPVLKTVTPAQLEGIVYAKTGYRWEVNGRRALTRNADGLAVLAGGTDSVFVNNPNHEPSVGLVFVQERLAQAAGWHVARHDLAAERQGDAILLRYVTRMDTPETNREAFRTQIEQLYAEVLGIPLEHSLALLPEGEDPAAHPEPPEVEELIGLWKRLYSVDANPENAWAGVTSVVLRDPLLLFY
jgi:hypothetical protein